MRSVFSIFSEHFGRGFKIYESSLKEKDGVKFFMVKGENKKYLVVVSENGTDFKSEKKESKENLTFEFCPLVHENAEKLRKIFPELNPSRCGLSPSFGTGDRLGITTPAHIRAFEDSELFPVLAQQSVRENSRTGRSWEDVLHDAVWGIFQEGYSGEFGADADHIKNPEELESAARAGFIMFTIDPSDHVRSLKKLSEKEKNEIYENALKKTPHLKGYAGKIYDAEGVKIEITEKDLRDAVVVYYDAIEHVEMMYKILKDLKSDFDFEVSVDETEDPTTPAFHAFIAEELIRRGVEFQNLALRFIGDWQKAIDYIGDVEKFSEEVKVHGILSRLLGGYKLSLHSGSDKFSVYPSFSKETKGKFHVKTAGTSYVEAIKIVAKFDPDLYRKIHKFALTVFDKDRASYHVTTDLSKVPDVDSLDTSELLKLFENPHARQLIHITYGSVLNAKDEDGTYLFRDGIFKVLYDHEEDYYNSVSNHIGNHIKLLGV